MAHPRLLRRVRGRAGAADVARGRRCARRRDGAPAPRTRDGGYRDRCSSSGASAARRPCSSARSGSCSRSADTTSARTCGSRAVRLRHDRPRLPLLRALGSAAASSDAAAARAAPPRRAAAPVLRGRAPLPRPAAPAREVVAVSLVVQAVRILAIWAAARAVGIELDPRIYYVMGRCSSSSCSCRSR